MYITITIQFDEVSFDISMDEQQRLFMGLKTLSDNHKVFYQKEPVFYRSEMQKRIISAYKTCKEEQIATGDKLIAII
ncbi:hypothetical protein [Lacrimispora indolis]|uniref:hypothetical protein n=1 Tax=Lacrimispora indolis TaxID=69825 RepID=UPI0003FEC05C|nr:hypothetical protein [[Clostridium] methoxybenzovorans]